MAEYLFLFSIGPVQSFIAQARKTQDFAAGSQLLSTLTDAAIETLSVCPENHIIFPDKSLPNKPNRVIAQVTTDNPQSCGEMVGACVRQKFEDIAGAVYLATFDLASKPRQYLEHLNSFLDLQWVLLPYDPKKDDYTVCYKRLEESLGAVKNIRPFEQLAEKGRKCSLDGERNVKFYRKTSTESREKNLYEKKLFQESTDVFVVDYEDEQLSLRDLQPGEGLSAISMTKRCLHSFPGMGQLRSFPSTSSIALMNVLQPLEQNDTHEGKDLYHKYIDFFRKSHFDTQLLYEENLTEAYFNKYGYAKLLRNPGLNTIRDTHQKLQEKVDTTQKHYALIRFDGDNMGKWLSGEFFTPGSNLLDFHKSLSTQLGKFAKEASKHLDTHYGRTVYAGGDDFLGFVNLNSLFEVLTEFHRLFKKIVNDTVFTQTSYTRRNPNHELTFSAGVVIAHYKTPLSEVIGWSKRMEDAAKDIDSRKNALAIAVLKHSGEIRQTVWKWRCKNDHKIVDILEELREKLKKRPDEEAELSNTFINALHQEFVKIKEIAFWRQLDAQGQYKNLPLLKTELRRLVDRSFHLKKEANMSLEQFQTRRKQEIATLTERWITLFQTELEKNQEDSVEFPLHNFLSLFHIADFIARKLDGEKE